MAEPRKLFTFEFVSLCCVLFFAFCNMSVFYSFFSYLERIHIPAEWRGFLVGLEPMSAFALRLTIIPLVHLGNATRMMLLALIMLPGALLSYNWAVTVPSLIALRIFHGAAFVLLVSGSMGLVVHLIPKERSAQGFGLVSVSTLIPYAVVPLVTEALLPYVETETRIYSGVSILALPAVVLLLGLKRRIEASLTAADAKLMKRPSMEELRRNFKHPGVVIILLLTLLLYFPYAAVFYFAKSYFGSIGAGDAGRFFAISSFVMILVRTTCGRLFDRVNKVKVLTLFAVLLAAWLITFGNVRSAGVFNLLAGCYGLCIGVYSPMLNSVLFHVSPEKLRGLNSNLSLFMMDAGFFLSPYLGGTLIAHGISYPSLLGFSSGFLVLSAVLLLAMPKPHAP